MINPGQVAVVKITNEPVFVLEVNKDRAKVRRAMAGESVGTQYLIEDFGINELFSSPEAALLHELDFTKFSLAQREKYSEEYNDSKKTKMATPVSDPTGYAN